jgi:hypothetical protein
VPELSRNPRQRRLFPLAFQRFFFRPVEVSIGARAAGVRAARYEIAMISSS